MSLNRGRGGQQRNSDRRAAADGEQVVISPQTLAASGARRNTRGRSPAGRYDRPDAILGGTLSGTP